MRRWYITKLKIMDIVFKHYAPIDYIIWGDDWGHAAIRLLFQRHVPRIHHALHKEMLGLGARFRTVRIELHSCGLTQQYIEEFVEMGLDAWTPQPINDLDMLTRKYGEKIALTVMQPEIARGQI